jgi:transposase InsO family protein
MHRARRAGKNNSGTLRPKTLGLICNPQESPLRSHRSPCKRQTRQKKARCGRRAVPAGIKRVKRNQGRAGSSRVRAILAKKKSELALQGFLTGYFKKEVKEQVVNTIKEAVNSGLTQTLSCLTFGLAPRKFRRWANPKPVKPRTAWNRLLPQECEAIENAVYVPDLIGKPLSHVFVHGHETGKFFASIATIFRVLKKKNLVKPPEFYRTKKTNYVSAHALMAEGYSLLCYDATQFKTESGIVVWAIPVLILPARFMLLVGHSLGGVSAADLTRTVKEAIALLPERLISNLLAHSDRGSAMKAEATKKIIKELLGAPVHYGRPHTPDDEAWIESLINSLKHHRDAPKYFSLVDDILQWLGRFPEIHNNDPHSAHKYVTPLQVLSGQKEIILNQRKSNLTAARLLRYTAWKAAQKLALPAPKVVVVS